MNLIWVMPAKGRVGNFASLPPLPVHTSAHPDLPRNQEVL
ncbi:hypothetical protein AB28_2522 [Raoultella ornithinolytica 2-156-04_S1_C2]|nr:hypothetical protein AB00_2334 [Raoultella ornithinolytica 2-156-04_S1_C1]KDX14419.1 hypothetical protein AB28_2522 [Raoultella ornithinolytica 2-156-04_S1_C2]